MTYLNYNIALLKTIKVPLFEELMVIKDALEKLQLDSSLNTSELTVPLNNAIANLKMVGRQSLVNGMIALFNALEFLKNQNFSDKDYTNELIHSELKFLSNIFNQIQQAESGHPSGLKEYFSSWKRMAELHHLESPKPRDVFDADMNMSDTNFHAMEAKSLKEVAKPYIQKLNNILEDIKTLKNQTSSTREAWKNIFISSSEVFDWAYAIRHRLGFHSYWQALRARVVLEDYYNSIGDFSPKRQEVFYSILRTAMMNLLKFSEDARRVRIEHLTDVIEPFLTKENIEKAQKKRVIQDAIKTFNLEYFWEQTNFINNHHTSFNEEKTLISKDIVINALNNLKPFVNEDNRKTSVDSLKERTEKFKNIFLVYLDKNEKLKGAALPFNDFLDKFVYYLESGHNREYQPFILEEVATALLLVEDFINNSELADLNLFEKNTKSLTRRLELAISNPDNLESIQPVNWSKNQIKVLENSAINMAFVEANKECQKIINKLNQYFEEEITFDELNIESIKKHTLMTSQVMKLFRLHYSHAVLVGTYNLLDSITEKSISNEIAQKLIVIYSSLEAYFEEKSKGGKNADDILQPAVQILNIQIENTDYSNQFESNTNSVDDIKETELMPIEPTNNTFAENLSQETQLQHANVISHEISSSPIKEPTTQDKVEAAAYAFANNKGWEDIDGFDAEIIDSFALEVQEILASADEYRQTLLESPGDYEAIASLRRKFHTLKGSGRMVGMYGLGEYAHIIENRFNTLLASDEVIYNSNLDRLVENAIEFVSELIGEFNSSNRMTVSSEKQKELNDLIEKSFNVTDDSVKIIESESDAENSLNQESTHETVSYHPEEQDKNVQTYDYEHAVTENIEITNDEIKGHLEQTSFSEEEITQQLSHYLEDEKDVYSVTSEGDEYWPEDSIEEVSYENMDDLTEYEENIESNEFAEEKNNLSDKFKEKSDELSHYLENIRNNLNEQSIVPASLEESLEDISDDKISDEDENISHDEYLSGITSGIEEVSNPDSDEDTSLHEIDKQEIIDNEAFDSIESVIEKTESEDFISESHQESISTALIEDLMLQLNELVAVCNAQYFDEIDIKLLNRCFHTLSSLSHYMNSEELNKYFVEAEKLTENIFNERLMVSLEEIQSICVIGQEAIHHFTNKGKVKWNEKYEKELEKIEMLNLSTQVPTFNSSQNQLTQPTTEKPLELTNTSAEFTSDNQDEDKLWDEVNERMGAVIEHFEHLHKLFATLSKLRK